MKIETKFGVGDVSWVVEEADDNGIYFVNSIEIFEILITKNNIYYRDSINEELFNEKDCFATKEEAQAEADRRNNEHNN